MNRKLGRMVLLVVVLTGSIGWWVAGKNGSSRARVLYQRSNHVVTRFCSGMVGQPKCDLDIPKLKLTHDQDGDGVNDLEDILAGARKDAANRPTYRDAYYRGGYPPENEGVCTDVVWRAFREAGYTLKDMVDRDIREHQSAYPRVEQPDPNIDFRRVLNLHPFFRRYAQKLTLEVVPGKVDNLKEWQGGDIVIFGPPYNHIAIVSDIRRKDGVPYIIHNCSPYTKEEDGLLYWHENISPIVGHYRWVQE